MNNPKYHAIAAQLSAIAYLPTEEIYAAIDELGLCAPAAKIIDGPGPLHERVLIVPTKEVCHVVFMGTKNKAQWRSNVDVLRKKHSVVEHGAKVHAGFRRGLNTVVDAVFAALHPWGKLPLCIEGHSRGGGMAVQFAMRARLAGKRIAEIHLFGCPRALNVNGSYWFNREFFGRCWSWVVNNDIVFRVPLRWMQFRHVGELMYFCHRDLLHRGASLWLRIKGQFCGRIKKGGFGDGIDDHSMARQYVRLVGSWSGSTAGGNSPNTQYAIRNTD